jgi:hypothetical protein
VARALPETSGAQVAEVAGGGSVEENEHTLMPWLRTHKINARDAAKYWQRMDDKGYDDLETLAELTEEELRMTIGLKEGHAKKLYKILHEKASNQVVEAEQQQVPNVMSEGEIVVPDEFLCPITLELMTDPVMAEDGHTYERSAIKDWLANGNGLSPKTQAEMGRKVTPNYTLRALIASLGGKSGELPHVASTRA